MSHDVIYFPSEKYFSDRIYVCLMDPSEPSESRFVHRSQIANNGTQDERPKRRAAKEAVCRIQEQLNDEE